MLVELWGSDWGGHGHPSLWECSSRAPKAGSEDGAPDFGHRLAGNQERV